MLNKVYIKYNPLIKEDTYNKMLEIVKSWPLQGSPCNWADSNSYTQFKKHGVFWIDGTYPFSYGVDCSNQGYKEISIQDIFNHELLKVEKWALGTFVLFLKDVAGARKGTIDIIEDNAPHSIYLKKYLSCQKSREDAGQIMWFATKESAEAYYQNLSNVFPKSTCPYQEGQEISCVINGTFIEKGFIHYEDERIFICQDKKNGIVCRNTLGCKYSWIVVSELSYDWGECLERNNVTEIVVQQGKFYKEDSSNPAEFQTGQYIVALLDYVSPYFKQNHIYLQNSNDVALYTSTDSTGDPCRSSQIFFYTPDTWRFATLDEIAHYKSIKKPYDVTVKRGDSCPYPEGTEISCTMKGKFLSSAKITYYKDNIVLCQNVFDGYTIPNRLGYNYSFALNYGAGKTWQDILNHRQISDIKVIDRTKIPTSDYIKLGILQDSLKLAEVTKPLEEESYLKKTLEIYKKLIN